LNAAIKPDNAGGGANLLAGFFPFRDSAFLRVGVRFAMQFLSSQMAGG